MKARLKTYVYGDPRDRHRHDRISLAISFTWYLGITTLKVSPEAALWQSVTVLILCQAAALFWYCFQPERFVSSMQPLRAPVLQSRHFVIKALGTALGVAVFLRSLPKVEAAAIDDRLQRLSRNPSPRSLTHASDLLSVATDKGVVVATRPVEELVAYKLTLSDAIAPLLGQLNEEAEERGIPLPLLGFILRCPGGPKHPHIKIWDIYAGSDNPSAPMITSVGSFVPPDMVAFAATIGSPHTRPTSPGAAYIRIDGSPQCETLISLDGTHCKNVIFTQCTLSYSGQAVVLENTTFVKSKFEFSANLACQRVAAAILRDPAVDFAWPPESAQKQR